MPQERVILAAAEPLDILGGLTAIFRPFGTCLDAVQLDGLLGLLYGTVEVALTHLAALFVGYGVERQYLRAVVLMARLLLDATVDKRLRTIIIGIVASIEGVPPACLRGIILCRAAGQQQGYQQ